jgi:hypothetical protein
MQWFSEYKSISNARKEASKSPERRSKFQAYTLTTTNYDQINAEISKVKANQVKEP